MPERNRATPTGEIVAIDQRGLFMGNRGVIHRDRNIVRPWQVRRWITCVLQHRDWVAPKWEPRRWTALFFWDEAVAIAAGHRPCALCRHPDFVRWMDAWEAATGERPLVDAVDRTLHADRVTPDRPQRGHEAAWSALPEGTFVRVADHGSALVLVDRLVPWRAQPDGYGPAIARPTRGRATVLTPRTSVAVLRHGYVPALHPTASSDDAAG